MADIKVTIAGDGSGARSAFQEAGEGASELGHKMGEAIEVVHLMVEGFEKLGGKVVEFAKESVEEFFKVEKAQRQLARAAGENTEAFIRQGEVLSEQFGIGNETVNQMQKMLLTFGEAPEEIDKTVRALMDYAAWSGTDAVSATHSLITSVAKGRDAFKELGLQYEKTGDAGTTLANVTQALQGKIGGTAEDESKTLEGATKRAAEQFNQIKEAFGYLVADFGQKSGIVEKIAEQFSHIAKGIDILSGKDGSMPSLILQLKSAGVELERLNGEEALFTMTADQRAEAIAKQTRKISELQKALIEMGLAKAHAFGKEEGPEGENANDHGVKKGPKSGAESEREKNYKAMQKWNEEDAALEDYNRKERLASDAKFYAAVAASEDEASKKDEARSLEREASAQKAAEREEENRLKAKLRADEEFYKKVEEADRRSSENLRRHVAEENKKFETEMRTMGEKIGEAFISALDSAVKTAMSGGEVDVLGTISDLAFGIASIVGAAIADIYAPGSGRLVGAGISGLGSIVHSVRAKSWQDEVASRKHHDGGWIGEYHSGGWPGVGSDEEMAVLQRGEAVWSRQQVAAAGGPSAVDRMRKGGGGGGPALNFTIYAQDSNDVRAFYEDRGGRGFFNALRTGGGMLPVLFPR